MKTICCNSLAYFNCSRYHILKEKHSKVDSIESFGELLRYNNYENDFWRWEILGFSFQTYQ